MIIHRPGHTFRASLSEERAGNTFQCQLKISICINRKWFPFPVFPRRESALFSPSLSRLVTSWHKDSAKHAPAPQLHNWSFILVSNFLCFLLAPVLSAKISQPLFKRQHCWQNEVTTWEDCESEGRGEMENWILDTKQPGTANKKYSGVFLLLCVIDCL